MSTTSFITKNVRVWRTPGSAISCSVEILHVADADLEEVIEIAGHQMAVEHEFQFGDRLFEGGKTLRRGTVEHDADHDQRALADPARRHHGADPDDKTLVVQPLGAAMTGRGADADRFGEFGIAEPPVILKQTQHLEVDTV